ncbi:hypothetical protein [Leptolyngbya iicbica]|uniref:Uncharacterized protein n=2 Tax=Cyanophyceae TaxID=3028117 RepID=A0A4Q7EGQ0_9CYAN|nr:hypothetical protein [Leptolyngbya sp. LK]RZM82525.1 hypothetical protein DYY88_04605 [Leptolyngbya sp. LK]
MFFDCFKKLPPSVLANELDGGAGRAAVGSCCFVPIRGGRQRVAPDRVLQALRRWPIAIATSPSGGANSEGDSLMGKLLQDSRYERAVVAEFKELLDEAGVICPSLSPVIMDVAYPA